jgi:molybdate transport repressor ModE-like protein
VRVISIDNFSVKKKIWLEYNNKSILGSGRYFLLKDIEKTNSVKKSADNLNISEKTAHNHIKKIETRLSKKIIESSKGGKNAGGKTVLTSLGKILIKRYEDAL